ncbi:MAG TPA: aldehyde dehydrogenase family protein, partial [Polyangiaceae bacterium]|nr:aldehyde dehydrogenase family protein [Polyangiaceae bacterium]
MSTLQSLGIDGIDSGACWGEWIDTSGAEITSLNPATEQPLGKIRAPRIPECQLVAARAAERFEEWRMRPAPKRGELVRDLGNKLREKKRELGELVSLEVGKIRSEGLGEVQEAIDICDYAVGLSRQLYGLAMHSERPKHRMFEQWHPLGQVGVITAFNFPVAVWAWNAAIAAVCGDVVLWKPSPHAPLISQAVQQICNDVMKKHNALGVFNLLMGDADVGEWLADNKRVPLVSFTGSIAVGRHVSTRVGARLGRSILELSGNNAIIVLDDADLSLAARAITFGSVGTAGQRCTSTRRVFAQSGICGRLTDALVRAYKSVKIGDPLGETTLLGPLIDARAVEAFTSAIEMAKHQGGEVLCGGKVVDRVGYYVEPTIIRAPNQESFPMAWEETFGPILYVFEVHDYESAIRDHNAVTQG